MHNVFDNEIPLFLTFLQAIQNNVQAELTIFR